MTRGGRRESDPRAEHLLARFAERFGRTDVPVPVDAVASDLLGLFIVESEEIEVSGLLVPASRYVFLNAREARESAGRRRFTLAHEIGHWVCQCDEGRGAAPEPILCREADLSGEDGLELRVRGGGRPFEVELDDGTRGYGRTVSRRAPVATTAEWAVVRVPFTAFRSSIFGRPVNAPPMDPSRLRSVGLYLLDGRDGPFRVEVDYIRTYRGGTPTSPAAP